MVPLKWPISGKIVVNQAQNGPDGFWTRLDQNRENGFLIETILGLL